MENKKDLTRKQILNAAFECFAEHGYLKTSFIDIAKRAGISRSLIYLYFMDKKNLFVAMTEEIHDDCIVKSQRVLDSDLNRRTKLQRLIDIWLINVHHVIDKTPNPNAWIDALKSDRSSEMRYRELFAGSLTPLLGKDLAEVVVLSIKGLLDDRPQVRTLEKRIDILIDSLA